MLIIGAFGLDRSGLMPQTPVISSWVAKQQPVLTLNEAMDRYGSHDDVKLARQAILATEPAATILITWKWTRWRLFSDRAVVADLKFFSFSDDGMKEWYDRYLEIYDSNGGAV